MGLIAPVAVLGLIAAFEPAPDLGSDLSQAITLTSLIDGQCEALSFEGVADLSGGCRGEMRIDDHADGGVTVTFTSGEVSVAFSGSGRVAAMPGGPNYLSVDRVVLAREGEERMVREGAGSCGRSGGAGPQRVRCAILGGGMADFTTAGTAPRRSSP